MTGTKSDEQTRNGGPQRPPGRASEQWALLSIGGGVAVAVVWFLYSSIRSGREGFDLLSPLLMIGLPVVYSRLRPQIDGLLGPIQPLRARLSKMVLIGMSLVAPFFTAFLLSSVFGVSNYPLMHWNLIIGSAVSYALVRDPIAPPGVGPKRPAALLALIAVAFCCAACVGAVVADDCLADPLNAQDCLRTGGAAELIAGLLAAVLAGLINLPTLLGLLAGGGGSGPGPGLPEIGEMGFGGPTDNPFTQYEEGDWPGSCRR
jgi:hypothetical protein